MPSPIGIFDFPAPQKRWRGRITVSRLHVKGGFPIFFPPLIAKRDEKESPVQQAPMRGNLWRARNKTGKRRNPA
jgi:hypothetical protein